MKVTNTQPLRMALAANAVFSLTCASMLITFPSSVGDWLGVQAPMTLRAIGIGLIGFAADLLHQTTRPRVATWRALYASAADFLWVIGTLVLLALFPGALAPSGILLVLLVALAVLLFGTWQLWAIGQAHRLPGSDLYRHCIAVSVNAPADAMWRVIARIGEIERYMPSLRSSSILDGTLPGVGAIRVCEDHNGKRWSEECTAFNAGRSFEVRFHTEAPDFPFPARTMHGGWQVMADADDSSEVMVWWELEPKPKLLTPILLPVLAFQADRDFPKVIERMAADAAADAAEGRVETRTPAVAETVARLVPRLC